MILIIGIPSEPPVKLIIEEASKQDIKSVIFNQRNAHTYDLKLEYIKNKFTGLLQVDGNEYNLEDFTGVYVRMMDYNLLPEIKNKIFNYVGNAQAVKSISIQQQLMLWLDGTEIFVANRPMDMLSNMSKPYQSQFIAQSSLLIPPTLITNNNEHLDLFKNTHKNLIFKSISSVRSIVKNLNNEYIPLLKNLKYLATQFQKKLEGENIRVHVVGEKTFATKIISSVTDYRYASREGKESTLFEVELPDKINKDCIHISRILGLPLCGIDLFKTLDERYYCFEVNPSPAYSYYQESTGQNISLALVNLLVGKNRIN